MKKGIIFDNVSFVYKNSFAHQLNNITLYIPQGSFCGITGVNGSGKTTLTLLINGLIPHQITGILKGNVYLDGINTKEKPVSYFAKSTGMVFQNPDFMLFNLTVKEEIEFGLKNLKLNNHNKRIKEALKIIGMSGFENCNPQTLSFGQKQKICLASIIAQDPKYVVLDEPTAMLDYQSTANLYKLLKFLNQQGKTIIIVEHDTDFLRQYANQIIILDQGKIVEKGSPQKVFFKINKLKKIGIKVPSF